jgi:hypothetical protein
LALSQTAQNFVLFRNGIFNEPRFGDDRFQLRRLLGKPGAQCGDLVVDALKLNQVRNRRMHV